LNAHMIVISIAKPGGPEVLQPIEMPLPQPERREVLIRVAAAGVNRPDLMQREGKYPPPPGASDIPGLEVSGTIAACGRDTQRWREGDRVCALVSGGGYAEYCVAPDLQCLPLPSTVDLVSAGGMPETFFTVWTNVFGRGHLGDGETFLVHGGASGIGTTAIQMARAFGARVFATAGTDEKCAACERLGAERAINYRTEDFVAVVLSLTGGRGVDVILDMVGAPYFVRNVDLLALEGRLLQIAVLHGAKVEINLVRMLRQRLTITGSTLRSRSVDEKAAIATAVEKAVWPLVEAGKIRPIVYATFPLRQAAEAHRLMESGSHIGKIVLTV
jgi:NADPH2:quinone reductase